MTSRTELADLHTETWGDGAPVVLVHGSLATGADEWAAQRPLADHGYRLVVPDRRGYGSSPRARGEDYLVDAEDIDRLLGEGAHLVAHSYGGLGALIAAGRRPDAVLSLTLLEPPVASVAAHDPEWQALVDRVRSMWQVDLGDRDWVVRFLVAVGSDPDELGPDLIDAAVAMAPVVRAGRLFADAALPLDAVRRAPFPKLVVSGGHHRGFEAMAVDLADRIGARHAVLEGAGHEMQFLGEPLNRELVSLWSAATE